MPGGATACRHRSCGPARGYLSRLTLSSGPRRGRMVVSPRRREPICRKSPRRGAAKSAFPNGCGGCCDGPHGPTRTRPSGCTSRASPRLQTSMPWSTCALPARSHLTTPSCQVPTASAPNAVSRSAFDSASLRGDFDLERGIGTLRSGTWRKRNGCQVPATASRPLRQLTARRRHCRFCLKRKRR
jgi:hypothetical protein